MRDDSSTLGQVGAAGVALLVALSLVAGIGVVSAGGTDGAASAETSVTFENQTTEGETVVVEEVTLEEGGFVAIHDASLLDGVVLDSVVGVSEYLEAGTHEDVEVTLYEGVEGADFEQSSLEEDGTLIAMPHLDTNDNEAYDFVASEGAEDGPYTSDGEAIVDSAEVTVEGTDSDDAESGDSQKADKKVTEEDAEDTEETDTEDAPETDDEDAGDTEDTEETADDGTDGEDAEETEDEEMAVTAEDVEGAMDAMGVEMNAMEDMGMTAQDIADLLNEMLEAMQSASGSSAGA